MSKIIAVANQKGGVGKTTTTVNLSACFAQAGKRVLCVDLDPQGNSTSGLGIDKEAPEYSIYDVLINDVAPAQAVVPTQIEGLDLLSSRKELSGAEVELVGGPPMIISSSIARLPWGCSPSTPSPRRIPYWPPSSANTMPWKAFPI